MMPNGGNNLGHAHIDDSGLESRTARSPARSGQATGLEFMQRYGRQAYTSRDRHSSLSPDRGGGNMQRGTNARRPVRVGRTPRKVETTTEKRARIIQEKLEEKRAAHTQQGEVEMGSIADHDSANADPDSGIEDNYGAVRVTPPVADMFHVNGSRNEYGDSNIDLEGSGARGAAVITTVTFPHYEVAAETGTIDTLLGELVGADDSQALASSQCVENKTSRNRSQNDTANFDQELAGSTDTLRRNVEARRSYNTKSKADPALIAQRSTLTRGKSMDNLDDVGMSSDSFDDNGNGKQSAKGLARPSSPSSATFHGLNFTKPGSSVVGPILDIEPAAIETNRMSGLIGMTDRRRRDTVSRQRDTKDPTVNPGISSTTHMLLHNKMSKQVLSFPEITADQQRKAGCTPRPNDQPYAVRTSRGHSRSPPRGTNRRSPPMKRNSSDKLLTRGIDGAEDLPTTQGSNSYKSSVKSGDAQSYKLSIAGTESSRKSSRDRYSRMKALGLPKVNIDIDRNHFSRTSLKRRSLQLRERYDMPVDPAISVAPTMETDADLIHSYLQEHNDMQMEAMETQNGAGGEEKCSTIVWSNIDDMSKKDIENEIIRVSEMNKPSESVTCQSINGDLALGLGSSASEIGNKPGMLTVSTDIKGSRPGLRSSRSSSTSINKEAVSVSYFKMGQPGKKDNNSLVEPPVTPRFKQIYQGASEVSLNQETDQKGPA